ncbi:pseudouridine synthase [Rummeliibacillus sp. JY-2-4R]
MRLDKLLSNMGYGSRKEVKNLLKMKAVSVDGVIAKDVSLHVDPDKQNVTVLGERVQYQEFIYLMMNKPAGVISATEDLYDQTVIDLLDPFHVHFEPFPVGRLDKDTEGFLLITNDGVLAHNLLSPKKHVPKVYYAKIDGRVTEVDIEAFRQGVILEDGYHTKPGELNILKSGEVSEIELTISEGKFHQVKRMFEAVGKRVTYLKRLSMGNLQLDESLSLGKYRELTKEEIEKIKEKL